LLSEHVNRVGFHPVPAIALAIVLIASLAAPTAWATWSIVAVNTETGEAAVGSATCVPDTKLKKACGVIVVGKGAGQAQASSDMTGQNRATMAQGFLDGLSAAEILAELEATDPQLQTHQYGIADLMGGAATFTGAKNSKHASGVTGKAGPIAYAIQGNILTGEDVILEAEWALLSTQGDLSQRIMAAMHAAKYYGGDGRCSCRTGPATKCGCPPVEAIKDAEKKWKSAHVSYLVVARIGDKDGEFSKPTGFASGEYYLDLNVIDTTPVDPVDTLQDLYDQFRAAKAGHADHLLTEKAIYPEEIRADGVERAQLMIQLVDLDGELIPHGGAAVTVTHDEQSAGSCLIGPVRDHGNGVYAVNLLSSAKAGKDVFRVVVDDGEGPVTLYPFPTLEVVPAAAP